MKSIQNEKVAGPWEMTQKVTSPNFKTTFSLLEDSGMSRFGMEAERPGCRKLHGNGERSEIYAFLLFACESSVVSCLRIFLLIHLLHGSMKVTLIIKRSDRLEDSNVDTFYNGKLRLKQCEGRKEILTFLSH